MALVRLPSSSSTSPHQIMGNVKSTALEMKTVAALTTSSRTGALPSSAPPPQIAMDYRTGRWGWCQPSSPSMGSLLVHAVDAQPLIHGRTRGTAGGSATSLSSSRSSSAQRDPLSLPSPSLHALRRRIWSTSQCSRWCFHSTRTCGPFSSRCASEDPAPCRRYVFIHYFE